MNPPGAASPACRIVEGGVEFAVRVSPGSPCSKVKGAYGTALKVCVRAPPERGKANAEVEEVLAEFLGLPRAQVRVVSGLAGRSKRVRAFGPVPAALAALLARALSGKGS